MMGLLTGKKIMMIMSHKKHIVKITEDIYKSVKPITEEKGINLENVVIETKRIRDLILGELMRSKVGFDNTLGVKDRHCEFEDTLFGTPFKFNVTMYYFTYEEYKEKRSKYVHLVKNGLDKSGNTLYFTLTVIDGELLTSEFVNSVQHEVQHYFETNLSGSEYNRKPLYKYGVELMNGNNSWTKEEYDFKALFGTLFYLSFIEEREGFANGLYAYLMEWKDYLKWSNIEKYMSHDESYVMLMRLYHLKEKIVSNNFTLQERVWIDDILKESGKEWNTIVKMVDYTFKDYLRRINNVKKLIIKQLNLTENVHIINRTDDFIDRILELKEITNKEEK